MKMLFKMNSNLKYHIAHPVRSIKGKLSYMLTYQYADRFPDMTYIKLQSILQVGYLYNLKNPRTFNEKLNWLKLHDHNPQYTVMADKLRAKRYVAEKIGPEYIVPLVGEWSSAKEIDFSSLPDRCVIKANDNSGSGMVFYKRGDTDEEKARVLLERENNRYNYFYNCREWPYKDIKKKIFAEQFIETDGNGIDDYKFWCFNGEPKIMYVTCKFREIFENFYDMDFNPLPIDHGFPRRSPEFLKPDCFDEMVRCARILSRDIPFVRIDFFMANGRMYFGECTFFDWGGFRPFRGGWDKRLGELISLN